MKVDFEKLPRFKAKAAEIESLIDEWAAAYDVPNDAIIRQISVAHAWCNANPKKAPKDRITRFLWNWMGKAREWGNLKSAQRPTIKPKEDDNRDMTYDEMVAIRRKNMGQIVINGRNMKGAIDVGEDKGVSEDR